MRVGECDWALEVSSESSLLDRGGNEPAQFTVSITVVVWVVAPEVPVMVTV